MKTLLLALLSVGAMLAEEPASPKVRHRLPVLASVFPQGSEAGKKLRVEVLGEYVDRARHVVFLDSSIRGRILDGSFTGLEIDLEVAPDAALGPHYFRIISPRGASNLLLFRVGDQPHSLEREPNNSLEEAQELPVPVTLNGRLNVDGDFDFFKFRAGQGDTWVFDLRAARNGSGLDAALILLDSEGRKLAHAEDFFIWDPFFTYTFHDAGLYYVVIQPTHARIDPNFAYQLDIRRAPQLETVSPISLTPGASAEATIYGWGLTGSGARLWFDAPGFAGEVLEMRGSTARVKIAVPAGARLGPHQFALATPGGRSNLATFLVDATPVHKGGDAIVPPVSINGIARYRQPERFFFDAAEGQTLVFEVRAQRFGSPVDSILRILDDKGKEIAVNDEANFAGVQFNKDSQIVHTFKRAGRYQLDMRNLWAPTGEDFPYQLLVRPPQPGFDVMLASDQPYIYAGENSSLKLTVARRESFNGPIHLNVSGLPEGVTAEPAEVTADQKDVEIRLHAADAKPGAFAEILVMADGAEQPAWRSVRIASGGGEGATFARVSQATLVIVEKPQFALEVAATNVNLVRGGTAEIPVQIQRARGFDGPIRFQLENLPPGVELEPATAAPGATDAKIRLRAVPGATRGRFSRVAILGSSDDGRTEEAPRITLQVD